jgi:hypothetical protein
MPLVAHADKLRAEVWLGRARILDVGDARVVVDGGFLTALAGLERVRQFVVTLVPGVARCAVWARVFHRRFGFKIHFLPAGTQAEPEVVLHGCTCGTARVLRTLLRGDDVESFKPASDRPPS